MVLSHSANFVFCSNSDERSLHDLDPVNRGPGLQVQRGWHQEVGGRLGDRKNGPRRPNEWKKSVWKDGNVTEVAGDWPYFPLKRLCYGYTYRTYPYTSHLKRHPWIWFFPLGWSQIDQVQQAELKSNVTSLEAILAPERAAWDFDQRISAWDLCDLCDGFLPTNDSVAIEWWYSH